MSSTISTLNKHTPDKFPKVVLENILQHLSGKQLLQVRSICRTWRETVDDCSMLMEKLLLKFPEDLILDRKYRPPTLIPARNLCFFKSRISAVEMWWPSVGEKLVHLCIKDCQISYAMLLKMLNQCPNLKSLEYLCPAYPAVSANVDDFKFEKLENLKINNETIFDVVYDFTKMCPNLKDLKIAQQVNAGLLMQHVNMLKDILVEVEIDDALIITHEIGQFKRLKCIYIDMKHPSDHVLRTITRNLPELREISVEIASNKEFVLSFSQILNSLENLSIKGRSGSFYSTVNFTISNAKNLRKLHLQSLKPAYFSLLRILKESSNLEELSINICRFENWSEIFSLTEKFIKLQRLELSSIDVFDQFSYNFSEYFDNLKYLQLTNCKLPNQLLVTFFSLCPELEDVALGGIYNVNDDVVLELLQASGRLNKLTITECSITDVSVDHIVTHGLMLKQVIIANCKRVTEPAGVKLKEHLSQL